jgi:hypothetical protein
MSQKRMIALVAAITVFASTAMLAANNTMGVAAKQTIAFSAPTVVGGTLLPAGNYNVTHQMNGQTHVMVFKAIGGSAEAKANCNIVPLTAKAEETQQTYTTNAKNERVLQEMTFAGDKAKHVLVQ